tara:strand:+ start:108 stop:821 length:714 start_codon:yes stop_codon:yes gene_type:complete
MSLAIIIPAYKESDNIKNLIKAILKEVGDPTIFIIDDSPNKNTEKEIESFKEVIYIYRGKKLGRGSAVIRGMKEILSRGGFNNVIEMDADLSHDPNEIPNNLRMFEDKKIDLLISSRYLRGSKILNWGIQRRIFSKLANFLARTVLKVPVTDYTNGFRIYSMESVKQVVKNCGKIGDGFIILSEILVELYFNNFKVMEVQSIFRNRIRGESSVTYKEIYKSLIGLIKIYNKKREIKK